MSLVLTSGGRTLKLGKVLGRGGEGTVHHVDGDAGIAIKIYTDGKAAERRDKIGTLVAGGYHRLSSFVAFPVEMVLGPNGDFIGFTMRKVAGFKPVHELYAPGSRKVEFPKADFRFLVRAAANVARAVASIHGTGCVIGDINHSGILVSEQATVTLIDSDSFQVRADTLVYQCRVGVGEYTPPELQGRPLETVDRVPAHDAFGLAVILFQLLFMGRHPFAGRYNGPGDMPIEKAIQEGRFAYSARKAETRMEPPPFVPGLADLTPAAAGAFEKAFQADPRLFQLRPSAADWAGILEGMEADLITCRVNPAHHHTKNVVSCPWCRLEGGMGISLFVTNASVQAPFAHNAFDLAAVLAVVDRVTGPGPAPDPAGLLSLPPGMKASSAACKVRSNRRTRRIAAVAAVAVAVGFMANGVALGFLGLCIAGYLILSGGEPAGSLRTAHRRAWEHWQLVAKEWETETGPSRFERKRADLHRHAEEHRQLPALEKSRLDDLERRKREVQLRKHLEAHLLTRARIQGIGAGRKATLASYGIEDAWDVTAGKVRGVPGFGEGLTRKLLDWRHSVERKFVFNPALGTDPAAIRQVKDNIARRRAELEQALCRGAVELQQIAAQVATIRSRPTQRLTEAYVALKQAELDAACI